MELIETVTGLSSIGAAPAMIKPRLAPAEAELLEHCGERLAQYRPPKPITFVDGATPQRGGQGPEAPTPSASRLNAL